MLNFEIRKKYFTMLAKKISDIYEIITGIPPLSMPNSKGKNLKSYSISGNVDESIIGFSGSDVVLPEGYTQLEYIQSSGTQYINTNYKPNANTEIEIEFMPLLNNVAQRYFGGMSPDAGIGFGLNTDGKYMFATNNSWNYSLPSATVSRTNVKYNATGDLLIDNVVQATMSTVATPQATLYLFAVNYNGTVYTPATMRIYYCRISENGVLLHEYIPCINPNNEIGLYDAVGNRFYGNAGTGTFTKSPFNLLRTLGRTNQAVSGNAQTKRILQCDKWAELTANNNIATLTNVVIGEGSTSFAASADGYGIGFPVKLKPNHNYTVYSDIVTSDTVAKMDLRISFYTADGTWLSRQYSNSAISGKVLKSFIVPSNADMTVILCARSTGTSANTPTLTFSNIMLVEGVYTTSNAPAYTPYKQLLTDINGVGDYDSTINKYKIPVLSSGTHNIIINNSLYKIGKNIDTVNYPQNKTVKAVGKYVFTGNEAIELYDNSKGFRFAVSDMETGNCIDGFCNRFENFKNMTDNNVPRVFFGYNNNYVYFRRFSDTATTAEAIKATLADWYSSGKPLTIWYPLEDETEEAVTLPDIPTVQGNATIIVDTSVQPSEMSVEYAIEGA